MSRIYFVSIVSRDNKPVHIQPLSHLPGFLPLPITPLSSTDEQSNEPPLPPRPTDSQSSRFTKEELLKLHTLTNTTLDIFTSPSHSSSSHPANTPRLLFIQDGVLIYGMQTNTRTKFIVGVSENIRRGEDRDVWERDREIMRSRLSGLMKNIWGCYLGTVVLNPFNCIDTESPVVYKDSEYKGDIVKASERLRRSIDGVVRRFLQV
ncbi:hypothetical protein WICPIJ_001437 [Wickerhamomyces pijperi]|uniref:Uncharacterized protein n=1 Tax=Wickerhamomyces pijperi TaxID=599730 RepID=A0A9P8TR49_WICPI|nr:hypothetical protein WICPIJ_001437 [Wickerhamomyces pijperi]